MPEPELISPLLDGFAIGEPISDHHGVCCCPALREATNDRYMVKIISIPASQVQLDALMLTGAFSDQAQALVYFEELAQGVLNEAKTLARLTKLEGFLPYVGSQLVQMSDGVGYQVYLLSPYKRSLTKHLQVDPLTHLGAVNLSLDLCAALAASRRAGYLYVDLKPNNIFLTQTQGWRIGDLGFIPLQSLKYASLPEKYRSEYTPPEISDAMAELNDTIDVYALGLVLYQVYNNGQLPFEDTAPTEPLPPPMYADYELAEIILKACHPNPEQRWSDPAQMGQAIVDYMQRNSVNDTPIVPPPVEVEPEPEEPEEEEFLDEQENEISLENLVQELLEEEEPEPEESDPEDVDPEEDPAEEPVDEDEDLSFIDEDDIDETIPSVEIAAELDDAAVTQEVEEMLAQADELISHELPEPVVAPDPIDVPFPAPIILDDEDEESEVCEDDDTAPDEVAETEPTEEAFEEDEAVDDASEDEGEIPPEPTTDDPEDIFDVPTVDSDQAKPQPQSKLRPFITIAAILILIAAIGFGGYICYQKLYLQPIKSLSVEGDISTITLRVDSNIGNGKLQVICTDTYGNTRRAEVHNGIARFYELTPNTQYRMQLQVSGLHRLVGTTTASFTTAAQTEIINLNASVGSEDGSVVLNFAVNGPEPDSWTVTYLPPKGIEKSVSFSGHTVTINNLTIGQKYRFTLTPDGDQYLSGTNQVIFTAQKIIYAQELQLTSCGDGRIAASWTAPEDSNAKNWVVRCYNDAGYDETITTGETAVEFAVPNHDTAYTITVTAEGMPQGPSITVSANPITITGVSEYISDDGTMKLTWQYSGNAPASGWIMEYSIDETAAVSVESETNEVVIPYYPGSNYKVKILPKDDVTCLNPLYSYDAQKAQSFDAYRVSSDDLSFYMCLTPDKEKWDRYDVPAEDYRKEFAIGEKISFLVEVWTDYKKSNDEIYISYVVRDQEGTPISQDTQMMIWNDMWEDRFGELNVPRVPGVAGKYTIEIYFNGYHVTTKKFTIT